MTTENGAMTVAVVMQEQKTSFLSDELQLKKLAKDIGKATRPAIDVLIKMLESTDEKMRMQAAIKLLEFEIDIKKAMSQDQMQRLIAEIKLTRGGNTTKQISVDEAETQKMRPVVDFSTVRNLE